jgi:hypothetical protein
MTNGPSHRPGINPIGHGHGASTGHSSPSGHPIGGIPRTPPPRAIPPAHDEPIKLEDEDELDPVALVDDDPSGELEKKIKAFGVASGPQEKKYNRKTICTGTGACRVKSFHGKLSDQGMDYLDNAINEWLDNHPEVEVKFVTSSVGQFEGKIREPALVLNVWY